MSHGFQVPGDLALSSDGRHLLLCRGPSEIVDRVRVGLRTLAGVWMYDTRKGLRYFQQIFEKPSSTGLALLRTEIARVIRETPGMRSVDSVAVQFDRARRAAVVSWAGTSDAGTLEDTWVIA